MKETILAHLDTLLALYEDYKKHCKFKETYIYNSGAIEALKKLKCKIENL